MKTTIKLSVFILLIGSFLHGQTNSAHTEVSAQESGIPFICPVDSGKITVKFGDRVHPVLKVTRHHDGIDIKAPVGQSVYATADGVVVHAGMLGGYGKVVKIKHGENFLTIYGHLHKLLVNTGQKVRKGDKIGLVGNSGLSSTPHLHYEIRKNGTAIDPLELMARGPDIK